MATDAESTDTVAGTRNSSAVPLRAYAGAAAVLSSDALSFFSSVPAPSGAGVGVGRGVLEELADVEVEGFRHAEAVVRVGSEKVADGAQLDLARHAGHVAGDVAEEAFLRVGLHQTEEISRLRVVVVAETVVVAGGGAGKFQRGLGRGGALLRAAEGIGLVVGRDVLGVVEAHGAVALVVEDRAAGGVDRELLVVGADAVALGVGVGEDARLEDLVGRVADAGDDVGGGEGGLLDLGVVVERVAVELEDADFVEREFGVGPDFGEVEGVEAELRGLRLGHDLDAEAPAGKVAVGDGVEEVGLRGLAVAADDGGGLGVGVGGDALEGLEVELHPVAFADGVEK